MESKSIVNYAPNGNDKIIPVKVNGDFFSHGFEDLGMQPWEPLEPFMSFEDQMQKMQRDMQLMQKQFNSPMAMPQLPPMMPTPPLPLLPGQQPLPLPRPMAPLPVPAIQNGVVQSNEDQFPGPIVKQSSDGHKYMELKMDVDGFHVDDINVFTKDNELLVHAKAQRENHNVNSDAKMVQEFKRQFTMPPDTRPEYLRCRVSKEGILTVDAPVGRDFVPEKKARRVKFALGSKESKN